MALTASPAQAVVWPEGIDLPEAMPGSGAVELIAGVGHLPSVSAAAADVADQDLEGRGSALMGSRRSTTMGSSGEGSSATASS